jgi:hypothetical protein
VVCSKTDGTEDVMVSHRHKIRHRKTRTTYSFSYVEVKNSQSTYRKTTARGWKGLEGGFD